MTYLLGVIVFGFTISLVALGYAICTLWRERKP
jgi:hypothetical protein